MEEIIYKRELLLKHKDALLPKLNGDQKLILDEVVNAVNNNQQRLIFVYGHDGTCNTFLRKSISCVLRPEERIVLAVASSGRYGVSVPALHKKPQRFEAIYAVFRRPIYAVKMDNPDITMEEYIELEAEKARRRGQTFNWETATYGKVRYHEDIDYFKDFETDFPAIVFNVHLATGPQE
ncbi:DNA helicase [Tanacetum coccineum]